MSAPRARVMLAARRYATICHAAAEALELRGIFAVTPYYDV